MDIASLGSKGFTIFDFRDQQPIKDVQQLIQREVGSNPVEWHTQNLKQDAHTEAVKNITDKVVETRIAERLMKPLLPQLTSILGPDLDVQSKPHLRMSRPSADTDLIGWHRDTFYGNSPWEMNVWLPLFPLQKGAGLKLMEGYHKIPSRNERVIVPDDPYMQKVTKGSTANLIGYPYMAKTDDAIEKDRDKAAVLLAPQLGQGVLFFGCMPHQAQNTSPQTRVTLDFRIKSMHAPTSTKPGYYTPLHRTVLAQCIAEFIAPS